MLISLLDQMLWLLAVGLTSLNRWSRIGQEQSIRAFVRGGRGLGVDQCSLLASESSLPCGTRSPTECQLTWARTHPAPSRFWPT